MNSFTQRQSIELNARTIYETEKSSKKKVTVSVAASPFYMPIKAKPSFDAKGNFIVEFEYDISVKTKKGEASLDDGVTVGYEIKTGRAISLTIPKQLIASTSTEDFQYKIEGVFKLLLADESGYERYKNTLNFGSYDAAMRSLKAYSEPYSKALSLS